MLRIPFLPVYGDSAATRPYFKVERGSHSKDQEGRFVQSLAQNAHLLFRRNALQTLANVLAQLKNLTFLLRQSWMVFARVDERFSKLHSLFCLRQRQLLLTWCVISPGQHLKDPCHQCFVPFG